MGLTGPISLNWCGMNMSLEGVSMVPGTSLMLEDNKRAGIENK
jgi:hypothetical protein